MLRTIFLADLIDIQMSSASANVLDHPPFGESGDRWTFVLPQPEELPDGGDDAR